MKCYDPYPHYVTKRIRGNASGDLYFGEHYVKRENLGTLFHKKSVQYTVHVPVRICIKPRCDKRRVYLIVATRTQSNMEEWIVYSMTWSCSSFVRSRPIYYQKVKLRWRSSELIIRNKIIAPFQTVSFTPVNSYSPVSLTPAINKKLRISPQYFVKIRNGPQ